MGDVFPDIRPQEGGLWGYATECTLFYYQRDKMYHGRHYVMFSFGLLGKEKIYFATLVHSLVKDVLGFFLFKR